MCRLTAFSSFCDHADQHRARYIFWGVLGGGHRVLHSENGGPRVPSLGALWCLHSRCSGYASTRCNAPGSRAKAQPHNTDWFEPFGGSRGVFIQTRYRQFFQFFGEKKNEQLFSRMFFPDPLASPCCPLPKPHSRWRGSPEKKGDPTGVPNGLCDADHLWGFLAPQSGTQNWCSSLAVSGLSPPCILLGIKPGLKDRSMATMLPRGLAQRVDLWLVSLTSWVRSPRVHTLVDPFSSNFQPQHRLFLHASKNAYVMPEEQGATVPLGAPWQMSICNPAPVCCLRKHLGCCWCPRHQGCDGAGTIQIGCTPLCFLCEMIVSASPGG